MEENNNIVMSSSPPVKTKRKKKKRTRTSSIFYVDNINIIDNDIDKIINSNNNNNNSPDSQSDSISITTTDSNTSTMSSVTISSPTNTDNTDESVATTTSNSLTINSSSTSLNFTLSINSTSDCITNDIESDIKNNENSLIDNNFELNDNLVINPKLNYVQQLRQKFEKLSFSNSQDDYQKLINNNNNNIKTNIPRRSLRKFVRCPSNNNANHIQFTSVNCNDNQNTEKFTWKHFNTIHSKFMKRRSSNIIKNNTNNTNISNNNNNNNNNKLNNNINNNNNTGEIPSEEEVEDLTADNIGDFEIRNTSYLETVINELSRNSMAGELTDQLEIKNLFDKNDKLPNILIDECTTESGSGSGGNMEINKNSNQNLINPDATSSPISIVKKVTKPKRNKKRNRSVTRPKTEIYEAKNYNVHMLKSHSYTEHILESGSSNDENFEKKQKGIRSLSNEKIGLNYTYHSKDVPHSIEELIETEKIYIDKLKSGIRNYGKLFDNANCPKGLKGKKYDLFGNIDEILELHEISVLPVLEKNRNNIQKMFEEFIQLIENNVFYAYVSFTINKRKSSKLCVQFDSYFKELQNKVNDNLGISSFLVQPIQRLTRYQLLFNDFLKKSFGNLDYRSASGVCAKLEKKMISFVNMVNESEEINEIEDCFDLNVLHQGHFKKSNEFHVYDYTTYRSYRSKAFIFEKSLVYTEIKKEKNLTDMKKDRLIYRGCYPYDKIGLISRSDLFTVFYERRKRQECDFKADPDIMQNWIKLITEITQLFADEEKLRLHEKYSAKIKPNSLTENDIYRKSQTSSIFRNSNRTSADSGISGMTPTNIAEEGSPNTTWYDTM